ncbi:MucR family transcriptional regulator [Geobacter benzoatilyticus]|uniref:MucR family transcriptional regulator n=1 Tax=Geobacter benzoatilyticus TaxID=2815309 RepID=A0ABX7Q154_9BACT|nr:MucR family transcriptional regulator [Geobacter benzoatilyticus]QSV44841.1 MucR family transcriptional regulator [Geobacter benzoatilyticus]
MAPTLLELTASIVSSHAAMSELSTEELVQEIQKVYATMQQLEGGVAEAAPAEEAKAPVISLKKAFQADQVVCMICGKGGMKTLTRHLAQVHNMKPREYRKQFNIPSTQALTARKFSEARKKMAQDRGLADNLAKARAVRAANIQQKKAAAEKPAKAKAAPRKKKA